MGRLEDVCARRISGASDAIAARRGRTGSSEMPLESGVLSYHRAGRTPYGLDEGEPSASGNGEGNHGGDATRRGQC
jgi:hypothetical protein